MPVLRVEPTAARFNGGGPTPHIWKPGDGQAQGGSDVLRAGDEPLPTTNGSRGRRLFGLGRKRSSKVEVPVLSDSGDQAPTPSRYNNNGLVKFAANVYSQRGEDGIVQEIFRVIGAKNRWCVEFGAWDGVFLSNTCSLIRDHGWSAVLIEGNKERCDEIRNNFPGNEKVHPICAMVGFEKDVDTIDKLLKGTPIPKDFDLISIDVDGVDWHIWESIVEYRPRVVIIEFNPSVPNDVVFIQDRDMTINEGCSIAALVELAKAKEYELVAVTGANCLFVVAEEFHKFGIEDNRPRAMRLDRPDYIFHGYNGKIYHTMSRLRWYGKNYELHPDSLQFLTEFWNKGKEGRSRAGVSHLDENGKPNLATADGMLREIYTLRMDRPHMDAAEFTARTKAVWAAAKAYMLTTPGEHVHAPPSASNEQYDVESPQRAATP
jgi:hypothetical protein